MKKILMVSTGGTIASTMTEKGFASTLSGDEILEIAGIDKSAVEITIENLFSIDSTLMQPEDWVAIAEAISGAYEQYDGFVVTHGTDTMSYTASMLAYMLGPINKPVIITGSMKTVAEEGTDAVDNLKDTFTAAQEQLEGVYVVFNHLLIRGCRVSKLKSEQYDAFVSVNFPVIAEIHDGSVSYKVKPMRNRKGLNLDTRFDTNLAVLKFFPGLNPDIVKTLYDAGYGALVLESYGTGGIPYRRRDIASEVEKVAGKIPIVLTTQVVYDGVNLHTYEVGQRALETGVISAFDMSKEASITKLMWAMGRTKDPKEVKEIMYADYTGEISAD